MDVKTPCLEHPEVARQVILLAVKQYRDRLIVAPKAEAGMSRAAGVGPSTSGGGAGVDGMAGRLARLDVLVQKGVLTMDLAAR